jgi:exosortase
MHLTGIVFYFTWVDQASLLVVIAALCVAIAGWRALAWAWPGIAFLLFMIPLPGRAESFLSGPLQRVSTLATTATLQTLGFFAQNDGNVILLSEKEIGVVEACSGLRMLMVFFAISTAVAFIQRRSLLERVFIVLSAIPIAVVSNVLRLTLTGLLYNLGSDRLAHFVYHDLTGWLMIPAAVALLLFELWFLDHLFVLPQPAQALASELAASLRQSAAGRSPEGASR